MHWQAVREIENGVFTDKNGSGSPFFQLQETIFGLFLMPTDPDTVFDSFRPTFPIFPPGVLQQNRNVET